MAIYIVCPNCKTEYSVKRKSCPKCGYVVKQNKTFRVSVSFHGKRIRQTVTGSNLQGAKEIEAKLKAELVSGEYYDRRQSRITFEQFVKEKYLPYAKDKKSYNREESLLRLWILPVMGSKTLSNISSLDVEKVKKEMMENGRAPRTVEYAIAVIRQVFNKAIEWGLHRGINPAVKVKKPKKDNRRVRFLTRDEAEKLLSELKKRSIQVYEMAFLSLYTGMRFGEIANLTWQDINFKTGVITIKDPKNNTSRVAYLTRELKDLLINKRKREKLKKPKELVFHRNGRPYKQIPETFKTVVDKLGLNEGITDPRDKVVFHTLRHTFASWLAIQGTPIYTIKELMGHKSLAMTERYAHLIPDAKREAVEKLFKRVEKRESEEMEA